ncbi:MAG: hypothetical protein K0Q95_121 [Bacteroidota bacterium]|jgi:hypothetical protein|nr:hypothetical protein [Bacteroidota bacterium]
MVKNYTAILFLALFSSLSSEAQIVINEVSSATVSSYIDEDGDQEDWIEFYNTSSLPVNMQGYTISRTEQTNTNSWTFPAVIIKPHDYLTVFCSGKNHKAYFDHWEVPVYANNPWKYFRGTIANPPANWRSISFNDASWQTGAGGIGYGDGDDSTIIAPAYSVFMRKAFTVADTSKIPTALILLDYDDGFVAYLNDVEIARSNIGVYGDHPDFNTLAYDEHEATSYQNGQFSGAYFVSPALIDSALKPGLNVFSIQVHSTSNGLDDLSAIPYFLIGVNDTTVTYFPFPADVNLHTDFDLKSTGQILKLTDASGNIKDLDTIPDMQINNTYGRRPDGAVSEYYFETPSPDTTNTISNFYTNYMGRPVFSLPPGFYNSAQTTSLASSSGIVRYTTDGSDPKQSSQIYSSPLQIDSTTVVRARVYSSNPFALPGEVMTNTYFINEDISLPVISLTSDPYNLFDYNYGIYEMGPGADTVNLPFAGANFWKGWERPANIEYFEKDGDIGFETPSSIAIQGNYSKAWPQKGFTVKTSDNYKGSTVNYRLFPDKPGITKYKTFNIRNAGSDWNTAHMRDRFNQKNALKSTHLDVMDGEPCVLFINGKYWGVYEIRERQDKHYIESNSGVSENDIDFLQFDGDIIEGSNTAFLNMAGFIRTSDMSVDSNYSKAESMLDIENFCDYMITETYIINIDWLGAYTNNIKFWRPNEPAGKWRYILWDTDLSLGFAKSFSPVAADTTNFLRVAIDPPTANPHSGILKGMLGNTTFRNYFVDRYADLMNTMFQPSAIRKTAFDLRDEMEPEMERHFDRWGNSSPFPLFVGRADDVPEWRSEIDTMLQFSDARISIARTQIMEQFGLVKQVDVTLDVSPAGAGTIKISTITPETFPWSGVYFDGVPVTITASPNAGYNFKYWGANSNLSQNDPASSINLNIENDDTFIAYFSPLEAGINVFPNPFSSDLTLNYQLAVDSKVGIKLYTVFGQEVAEMVSPVNQKAGSYTVRFEAENLALAQGVYFIEFKTDDNSEIIKLIKTSGN